MKHLILTFNNEQFTVEVDEETYEELIEDEKKLYDYTRQAYNFIHATSEGTSSDNIGNVCCENKQTLALAIKDGTTDCTESKVDFRWTHKLTMLLINLRLGKEKEFNRPVCKKKKLWDIIANEITNTSHINVNRDMCDSKYRNLLCPYKSNKKKSQQSDEDSVKWEYYKIFDEVLGYKAFSLPSKDVLGDINTISEEGNVLREIQNEKDSALESIQSDSEGPNLPIASEVPRNCAKVKGGKKDRVTISDYLSFKQEDRERRLEQEQRRNERWQEKKELKDREISAIEKLADAIAGKYSKRKAEDSD